MFDLHLDYIKDVAETEALDSSIRGKMDRAQSRQAYTGNHTLPRDVSRRNNSKRASYYDSTAKPIFVAKCLCIIQRLPYLFSAENILLALWRSVFARQPENVNPANLIYWILNDVPLPIAGTSIQFSYAGCDLSIRRPGICDLPFFDYPIYELFKIIPADKFVKLFTCFLLEHQILLCSKSKNCFRIIPSNTFNRTRQINVGGRMSLHPDISLSMAADIRSNTSLFIIEVHRSPCSLFDGVLL